MFTPTTITFMTEEGSYWIDMAFCVSMRQENNMLVCSFADGEKFTFHQEFIIEKVKKAFKLAKGLSQ